MRSREELVKVLGAPLGDLATDEALFAGAAEVRDRTVGRRVYLRGLIELSNRCRKNCLYCGIRSGNGRAERYELTDGEVLEAARGAWRAGYGSVVIQAGERTDGAFVERVERLVEEIGRMSEGKLGITLSLGEQTAEVYRRWYRAGAHRYLLRIEASSPVLYGRLHPADHRYERRVACLEALRETGYQVGTGVMIGLPFQRVEDLADDLLFFRRMDIDMCGMGPYIEHPQTPLAGVRSEFTREERLQLALRMIALLRLEMPDINIAATTALHALHPRGRELGVAAGANILMPNVTPEVVRGNYRLYEGKPAEDTDLSGFRTVPDGAWGDAPHYASRREAAKSEE
ncbi:[FeFe] hydrogenase H-cluster radical SAM maturase HydE [uncultured Rikenella sp.]|uniref:[FeFe] hydrogenase H-cluster radical SAM maturase HydE n=1 Tax=uncultured Rikenella sp. TaxID=368003 RepID=UPI0025DC68AF|nr:[FeFe] hydrogenase H-cluster radical SAM maturase HydE [uncultured Rikenella sp.]